MVIDWEFIPLIISTILGIVMFIVEKLESIWFGIFLAQLCFVCWFLSAIIYLILFIIWMFNNIKII